MKTSREENLALFLDNMTGALADDLEWALDFIDQIAPMLPKVRPVHAERLKRSGVNNQAAMYYNARRHLKTCREFQKACRDAPSIQSP